MNSFVSLASLQQRRQSRLDDVSPQLIAQAGNKVWRVAKVKDLGPGRVKASDQEPIEWHGWVADWNVDHADPLASIAQQFPNGLGSPERRVYIRIAVPFGIVFDKPEDPMFGRVLPGRNTGPSRCTIHVGHRQECTYCAILEEACAVR